MKKGEIEIKCLVKGMLSFLLTFTLTMQMLGCLSCVYAERVDNDSDFEVAVLGPGFNGINYADGVLTISTAEVVTISMKPTLRHGAKHNPPYTTDRILVDADTDVANIILGGVRISSKTNPAFSIGRDTEINLELSGKNSLISRDCASLHVPGGAGLVIEESERGGRLEATSIACDISGAGIGGNPSGDVGSITINSGTVTAKSISNNCSGAGIGSGGQYDIGNDYNSSGDITINGGNIISESHSKSIFGGGSGIGGGYASCVDVVKITGGTVTAKSTSSGAGIGSGRNASSNVSNGDIEISGGIVTGKSAVGAGIGGGYNGKIDYITITGGTVTAQSNEGPGIGALDIYSGNAVGIFSTVSKESEVGNAFILASTDSESLDAISDTSQQSLWTGVILQGVANVNKTGFIYGLDTTLSTDATIPAGYMLVIDMSNVLTIADEVVLTNNGIITGTGTKTYAGVIKGKAGCLKNNGQLIEATSTTPGVMCEFERTISPPSPKEITDVSITLEEVQVLGDGEVQYGYADNECIQSVVNWQNTPVFVDLEPDKAYYFFTRVEETSLYKFAESTGVRIKTLLHMCVQLDEKWEVPLTCGYAEKTAVYFITADKAGDTLKNASVVLCNNDADAFEITQIECADMFDLMIVKIKFNTGLKASPKVYTASMKITADGAHPVELKLKQEVVKDSDSGCCNCQ